jgi:hypothetical protein
MERFSAESVAAAADAFATSLDQANFFTETFRTSPALPLLAERRIETLLQGGIFTSSQSLLLLMFLLVRLTKRTSLITWLSTRSSQNSQLTLLSLWPLAAL